MHAHTALPGDCDARGPLSFPEPHPSQVPTHDWPVLDLFSGALFDPEARRALLALDSKQPVDGNKSPLGGLRPLIAMSCDSDLGIQQRAASSFVTLLQLAQSGVAKQPAEQLAALVAQLSRFTPSARSHAALGLANAALCPEQREALRTTGLLANALKQLLELCSVEAQPDVQGAAALALAVLSQEREAREQMLKGGAIGSLAELLRSADHDAVRCAAYTLTALAQLPEALPKIARAFSPRVLVMVCRSKDFFLQTVGAQLIGALAADPHQQLRLLGAHALGPLVATAQSSLSAAARFEATRALHALTLQPDVAIAARRRDMQTLALLRALSTFAAARIHVRSLRTVANSLNAKTLPQLLEYYEARPELAEYTVEHELKRMGYHVRTAKGEMLRGADAIRAHHAALESDEQRRHLLWRLANQSLVSDIIVELHNAGYAEPDLGASVRATSCTFMVDLQQGALRVLVRVGVFVSGPGASDGDEEPLQLAALEAGLVMQLPSTEGGGAPASAVDWGSVAPADAAALDMTPEVSPESGPSQTGKAGASDGETTATAEADCGDTTTCCGDTAAAEGIGATGGPSAADKVAEAAEAAAAAGAAVAREVGATAAGQRLAAACASSIAANAAAAEAAAEKARLEAEEASREAPLLAAKKAEEAAEAAAVAAAAVAAAEERIARKPREAAGRLKYSLRAAPSQPLVSRQQLLGAARLLVQRYEHCPEDERPPFLRSLDGPAASTSASDAAPEKRAAAAAIVAAAPSTADSPADAAAAAAAADSADASSAAPATEPPPPDADSPRPLSARPPSVSTADDESDGAAIARMASPLSPAPLSLADLPANLDLKYDDAAGRGGGRGGRRGFGAGGGGGEGGAGDGAGDVTGGDDSGISGDASSRAPRAAAQGASADASSCAASSTDDAPRRGGAPKVVCSGAAASQPSGGSGCRRRRGGDRPGKSPSRRKGSEGAGSSSDSTAAVESDARRRSSAKSPRRRARAAEASGGGGGSKAAAAGAAGGAWIPETTGGHEALFAAAQQAVEQVEYSESVGRLSEAERALTCESNAQLLQLELFIMALHLSSARLPRYLSALELHASLAAKLELQGTTPEGLAEIRLCIEAFRTHLKIFSMVKADARDMAKKLDSFQF